MPALGANVQEQNGPLARAHASARRLKFTRDVNIALYSTASKRLAWRFIIPRRQVGAGKKAWGGAMMRPGSRSLSLARVSKSLLRLVRVATGAVAVLWAARGSSQRWRTPCASRGPSGPGIGRNARRCSSTWDVGARSGGVGFRLRAPQADNAGRELVPSTRS